jgi:murein DD-endopeptidase MepM/ murein hydrolase activator NlpD
MRSLRPVNFLTLILILTISFFSSFNTPIVSSESARVQSLTTEYEKRKQDIESKKNEINSNLAQSSNAYNTLGEQKKNLSEEKAAKEAEIAKIEEQIEITKTLIIKIEQNIKENEEQEKQVIDQMINNLAEQQKLKRTSWFEIVLTSKNIGDFIAKGTSLSTLQTQSQSLTEKIIAIQNELELNKQTQRDILEQLDKTRQLLDSRKSSLQDLIEKTGNEQSKYEELIKSLADQQNASQQQLDQLGVEYLAEVKAVKKAEAEEQARRAAEAARQYNQGRATNRSSGGSSNFRPGPSGCSFETDGLNIPGGYFGPATDGVITQYFHCGHDGVDIASGMGTALYAIANGTVVQKGPPVNCIGINCNGGFGNFVVVEHIVPSGQAVYALYAHMRGESPLGVGTNVSKGQTVGAMGCTGYTLPSPCGVHLHFMLIADTLNNGKSCLYSGGRAKCYNPLRYIPA